MHEILTSQAVWDRLLAVRASNSCFCCGDFSAAEKAALALYGPIARRDTKGLTIGQIGQSLDGRIATAAGDASAISGPDGFLHLHRLRALVDGVVIGVRTALHDSPRLTVRHCEGENPARIVIDPRGRLPNDSPVLAADGARRILIQAVQTPRPEGVEVLLLDAPEGQFQPGEIIKALNQAGLNTLLVEGGSYTLSKFIEGGLLDRLHVAVAPMFIGSGPSGLTLTNPPETLAGALKPVTEIYHLGSDTLFDSELTATAAKAREPQH